MQRYRGEASIVIGLSDEGLRLQFLARLLRSFVGPSGVTGRFEIEYDRQEKLVNLRQIA